MKKRLIAIMAVLFLTVGSALAQVIITDEDVNHNRATRDAEEFGVMVPMQKFDGDQWKVAPLGNGILLLAGLSAAYLMRKRKEE